MRNISDAKERCAVGLSNLELVFENGLPLKKGRMLVAGGRKPDAEWIRKTGGNLELWAVDSGADSCMEAELVPNLCIGDFDSLSEHTMCWLKENNVTMERHPVDKDRTDLQLAISESGRDPVDYLIITGCWGGRFDHLWSLVFSCYQARLSLGIPVFLADHRESLFFMSGGEVCHIASIEGDLPEVFSLLALSDRADGVSISGVKWPLAEASLLREDPYAVSNVAIPDVKEVAIRLREGDMGVYMGWDDRGDFS